jgi:hypothetical protein
VKRLVSIVVLTGLFALPGLAQGQAARPLARAGQGQQQNEPARPNVQQRQQNQLRQSITNLYLTNFRTEVRLTEDQFLKIERFIQQFIQNRFMVAIERDAVNQELDQLLNQANPSSEAVDAAIAKKTRIDRAFVNMEPTFMEKIRADLTDTQRTLFYIFNRNFFDEKLPGLIERAKAQTGTQAPSPVARPNPNRPQNQNGPNRGDAFRDQNQQNK